MRRWSYDQRHQKGFWTSAIHVGAGSLTAAESGATVSDIDGRPWALDSSSIAASATPALHEDLLLIAVVCRLSKRRAR